MPKRRIFIAIDISDEARGSVEKYTAELRSTFPDVRVGWECIDKLHFTLKFLGAVDEDLVRHVEEAMTGVVPRHQPFIAEISGTGIFPGRRDPRILWLGMRRGRDEMVSLGTDIETALEQLGFTREPRTFSPHLTIGRIREPRKGMDLAKVHLGGLFPPVAFTVPHVTIYESVLSANGSVYSAISRKALEAARNDSPRKGR